MESKKKLRNCKFRPQLMPMVRPACPSAGAAAYQSITVPSVFEKNPFRIQIVKPDIIQSVAFLGEDGKFIGIN